MYTCIVFNVYSKWHKFEFISPTSSYWLTLRPLLFPDLPPPPEPPPEDELVRGPAGGFECGQTSLEREGGLLSSMERREHNTPNRKNSAQRRKDGEKTNCALCNHSAYVYTLCALCTHYSLLQFDFDFSLSLT